MQIDIRPPASFALGETTLLKVIAINPLRGGGSRVVVEVDGQLKKDIQELANYVMNTDFGKDDPQDLLLERLAAQKIITT